MIAGGVTIDGGSKPDLPGGNAVLWCPFAPRSPMVIWLASFPRSGNTMLRIMFRSVFGLSTYSKHEAIGDRPVEENGLWVDDAVGGRIGARFYTEAEGWSGFLARARDSRETYLIKTHDGPEGADKAIYVVRNGLVATDSYRHFLEAADGRPVGWTDLLAKPHAFENWSAHLDAWRPDSRPDTLLIRYEMLVGDPMLAIRLIRDFAGLAPVAAWDNPWTTLREAAPNFFRRGRTAIPEELTADEIDRFMAIHSGWMERLGYDRDVRFERDIRSMGV